MKPLWKQFSFWVALIMTNLGLLLSHGVLGGGTAEQVAGWAMTILTALGYRALAPAPADPTTGQDTSGQ